MKRHRAATFGNEQRPRGHSARRGRGAMSKFKAAGNAVLSGVKMERAAAGECVKVRRTTDPRRPVGLRSIETPSDI
jgi:hypothetical protein